jgi:tRNA-splicing ligase RtcB
VATLPGIVGASIGMPDLHAGYGFAIGNVAAFDFEQPDAVVSPGGVGFDINCGVRLLRSSLTAADLAAPGVLARLADALYKAVPAGTGSDARALQLDAHELERVLSEGMGYLEAAGLCWAEDREVTEERGCFPSADASKVSARAKARGDSQAGTLGAGNHYLEVQIVEEVYDEAAAAVMGLHRDGVCVMLHTGSRGLGHQVCTDYLQKMDAAGAAAPQQLVDRQLACVAASSASGRDYLGAMRAAANFAFVNRSALAADVRAAFASVFKRDARTQLEMHQVYDVAHNVAKEEVHMLRDGTQRRLLVHRKGATRAFPPGHPAVPQRCACVLSACGQLLSPVNCCSSRALKNAVHTRRYKDIGQPVLVGGSMSSASYVLVGTAGAMERSFGSTCHGAGRALSRAKALKTLDSKRVLAHCEQVGVEVRIKTRRLAAEEVRACATRALQHRRLRVGTAANVM